MPQADTAGARLPDAAESEPAQAKLHLRENLFVDRVNADPGSTASPRVQRAAKTHSEADDDPERIHEAGQLGIRGTGGPLPYLDQIQKAFGVFDVSSIVAHTDESATAGAQAMGAAAFTMGHHAAFAGTPSLHTAAHEAAHAIQQRAGVQLLNGVGQIGDAYEQHADAVADLVVRGQSSEALLSISPAVMHAERDWKAAHRRWLQRHTPAETEAPKAEVSGARTRAEPTATHGSSQAVPHQSIFITGLKQQWLATVFAEATADDTRVETKQAAFRKTNDDLRYRKRKGDEAPPARPRQTALPGAVQQNVFPPVQRQSAATSTPATISSPADLSADKIFQVIVVGAPGEDEVKANHSFQFANAAASLGTSPTTVWLVERTGYERAKVSLASVQQRAGAGQVFWIDESHSLADLLRQFRSRSISHLHAYSHGTAGLLALRHGWPGVTDYGLTTAQVKSLSPTVFTEEATISFDSCNSASTSAGDSSSLAEAIANATERPVEGWTGRTSYHDVNAPQTSHPEIKRSEIFTAAGSIDPGELWSRLQGRDPKRVIVAPQRSRGSFTSSFEITAALPSSRAFPVPEKGSVDLKIEAWSEYTGIQGAGVTLTVLLHRQAAGWFGADEQVGPSHKVRVGQGPKAFTWTDLAAGTYFVEIYHSARGYSVEGSISVQIR